MECQPYSLLSAATDVAAVIRDAAADCGVQVQDIEDIYPCTPLQAALMVSTVKSPGAYICKYNYTVLRTTDINRLRWTWDTLKATESVLRNRIVWSSPTRSFLQATIAHKCYSRTSSEGEVPMALGQDLFKVDLRKDAEAQQWLLEITIHHSIFDGWSLQLMLQRLKEIYASSDPPNFARPSFTWFIQHLATENTSRNVQSNVFWREYLSGASEMDFPHMATDPNHEPITDGTRSSVMVLNMQKLVGKYCVSPATSLYAASAIVLGQHSGSKDVIFGLTLSGRNASMSSIDDIVGPTIATVPFRTQIEPELRLEQYLKATQAQILDIVPHQHHGLQTIKAISPEAACACRFRSLVTVQPKDPAIAHNGLFEKAQSRTSDLSDNFPLSLEFIIAKDHVSVNCSFDSAYIPGDGVETMLAHIDCVLQDFSTLDLSSKLGQIELASVSESSTMLVSARNGMSPPPSITSTTAVSEESVCESKNAANIRSVAKSDFEESLEQNGSTRSRSHETVTELEIEATFQEVFQTARRLTTVDDFFQLGGDSVTAINLVIAAKKRGYAFSVSQIYQNPRLGDLAAVAEVCSTSISQNETCNPLSTSGDLELLRIEAARLCDLSEHEVEQVYPASMFQESLAAISTRDNAGQGGSSYVATVALAPRSSTNHERLLNALRVFVSRNPIFRTRLIHSSNGTMQVVCRNLYVSHSI